MRNTFAALIEGLPRTYWLIWLGTLINRLGGFIVPFLSLYLTGQRHIPVSQAGLMVSLFGAGSFIAQLAGGELTDRLGRRPVMLLSFLVTPAAIMALGLARDLTWIATWTFLVGVFTDLCRPAVAAAIADVVPPEARTRAYGYNYWAINVGAAIAPIVAGLLARQNYLILFAGDALTTLIFGLIVLFGIRETRPAGAHASAHASVRDRVAQLARDPILLVFNVLVLLFAIVYMQGMVTLPIDMQAHGLGPEDYGLAISVNGLLIVLISIQVSNLIQRMPRFGVMAAAAVLLGAGYGSTAFATTTSLFAICVAIWTLGEILGAVSPVIVADLAPIHLRGLYQGIFGSMWGLAFFIGPVLGGWILERYGAAFLWSACFFVGVFIAFGFIGMARPALRRLAQSSAQEHVHGG